MLLIDKPNFKLESDRRLVKAADVATVSSAADIIATAEADAARIREEAKVAFEEEKKRGYDEGLQNGKMEIAMQKLEQVDQSVAFMESVEQKMADVVLKALKSFVVEVGDKELVLQIVRKTMNAVIRTQRQVVLKVAPDMVETVRAKIAEFRVSYPTIESFDVVEDPRLKGVSCILETESGVADASIETQLAAIKKSLQKHIAGGATNKP